MDLSALLQEQIVMMKWGDPRCKWLTVGDFNDPVENAPAATTMMMANGEEVELAEEDEETPSRWGGN